MELSRYPRQLRQTEKSMSFLDDLENNLKSLESHEEGSQEALRQHRVRETQRASAQATAPYAEELKKGPYTAELLRQAARMGHALRVKIHIAWLGATLRLEARERRLELRPTPKGILAVWIENNQEARTQPVDLQGQPDQILREWLNAA
jgi:uncharacterized protein with von Willebrand factor type A (vWA) domain